MKQSPEEIALLDGRYSPKAFRFVYDGLGYTVKNMSNEPGHVSGQFLCEGLRRLALDRYGRLTMMVMEEWGVSSTRDFGEIVYSLIDHEWMSAQPNDTIDDFNDVFSFYAAFKDGFEF